MSFIKKALEVSEKAFDATEHSIEEWNTRRHASKLLLKLGIAAYAEQRLGGDHAVVERIPNRRRGPPCHEWDVNLLDRWPWLYVVIDGVRYEVEPAVADSSVGALFRAWCAGCEAEYMYLFRLVTVQNGAVGRAGSRAV